MPRAVREHSTTRKHSRCEQWLWHSAISGRQSVRLITRFHLTTPMRIRSVFYSAIIVICLAPLVHAEKLEYTRTEDVIYGRKFGTALTMDVFRPKSGGNGIAIVSVVSGGWYSAHDLVPKTTIGGGYTVFAVVHGSQPRYTMQDAVQDLNRAVRFIRFHAKDYGIDPDRIGITGGSAGGHLSLMQGIKPADANEKSPDPVERTSSRVQAVA